MSPSGPAKNWPARARPHGLTLRSCATVDIFKSDDVIFPEVAPNLHLDQFQRDFARICEPMHITNRDIDELVFVNRLQIISVRDFCGALDYDPMPGSMKMFLKRQSPPPRNVPQSVSPDIGHPRQRPDNSPMGEKSSSARPLPFCLFPYNKRFHVSESSQRITSTESDVATTTISSQPTSVSNALDKAVVRVEQLDRT